jgi:hypothetical protein
MVRNTQSNKVFYSGLASSVLNDVEEGQQVKRLLLPTILTSLLYIILIPHSSFASDDKLPACIQNISDFKCFYENRYRTYQIDNRLFWKHWRHHEARATACTSTKDTARFISLVIGSDGELAEAMYEFIENLVLSNVACFLTAAETLDDNVVNHLIRYYVMTPLYHDPSDTLPLVEKELTNNKYKRFNKLYFAIKKTKS